MMSRTFSISYKVTDPSLFYDGARKSLVEGGMSEAEADAILLDADGQIDLDACAIQLFDPKQSPPGVEILDSSSAEDLAEPVLRERG